jgi:hypothetical protein
MMREIDDRAQAIINKLRATLPLVFLGSRTDQLTGYSIAWGTVQNKRSRREIPNESEIFVRSGNRVLVVRDPFLDWWATTLSEARRPPPVAPPRRRRRGRADELVCTMSEAPRPSESVPPRRQHPDRAGELARAASSA